jgi:hypothetical protein
MTTVERDLHSEAAVGIALAGDRWQMAVLDSVVMTLLGSGCSPRATCCSAASSPASPGSAPSGLSAAAELGGDANLTPASSR